MKTTSKLFCLLFLLFAFASCLDKDHVNPNNVEDLIGTYTGTAQESYYDYGGATHSNKDTTYTNVQVSISKSDAPGKVLVKVNLPPTNKRHRDERVYQQVDVNNSKLFFLTSSRGCGCTTSIEGELKGDALNLATYDYSTSIIDSRLKVSVVKN